MKRKNIYIAAFFLLMAVGIVVCLSFGEESKNAVLTSEMEHLISREETDRLREILADNDAWYECEEEAIYYGTLYEIELDGMWYRMDTDRAENPIYYGKIGKDYSGLMNTKNMDLKRELNEIVNRWKNRAYSYEYLCEHFIEEEDQAVFTYKTGETYTISKEDTIRLRELFRVEAGWTDAKEKEYNSLEYKLQLDGLEYSFDLRNYLYMINCRKIDAVFGCEIYNENSKVVDEIFDILKGYVS